MSVRHPKAVPPKFFFRCGLTCGTYPVGETTARRFLSSDLNKKLEEALDGGAHGAILKFPNGCPQCTPQAAAATVELSVLKPKIH